VAISVRTVEIGSVAREVPARASRLTMNAISWPRLGPAPFGYVAIRMHGAASAIRIHDDSGSVRRISQFYGIVITMYF
jgi:hypothetical protein